MGGVETPGTQGFDLGRLVGCFTNFKAGRLIEPIVGLLAGPRAFFSTLKTRPTEDALFFFICVVAVSTVISLFTGTAYWGGARLLLIVFIPIGAAIGLGIVTLILHVIFGPALGGAGTMGDTLKIACYTALPLVVNWIPWVPVLTTILVFYWLIVAAVEVHGIEPQKAKLVLGILGAVLVIFSISGQIAAHRFRQRVREAEQVGREWQKAADEWSKAIGEMGKTAAKQAQEAAKDKE